MLSSLSKVFLVFGSLVFSLNGLAKTEGRYLVPQNGELQSDVIVDLEKAVFKFQRRGRVHFDYKLPKELAGEEAPQFSLRGTLSGSGPWKLQGEGVVATCTQIGTWDIKCLMEYEKVEVAPNEKVFDIDTVAAAEYVDTIPNLSKERALELKTAARVLRDEAIGVVFMKLK